MQKRMEETKMGEKILSDLPVLKFDSVGTSYKGMLLGITESKKYKDSYAMTLQGDEEKRFVLFVTNIVVDKLKQNNIETGETIKLTYKGKVKSKSSSNSYNDIEITVYD